MTISLDKKYRTRDGWEVRLFMIDGGGEHPVIGACKHPEAGWVAKSWSIDGRDTMYGSHNDLIAVKTRHVSWLNFYPGVNYQTKEEADIAALRERIACIRVEFEEGEGLS
jgi:hypothetical protein